MRVVLIICTFLLADTFVQAQNAEREKIRQIEQEKQAQQQRALRAQLDSAILLTDAGKYELADKKYVHVLQNLKSIPSDLTYHFGRNSYQLGRYSQSVDWLNKYVQLKGTSGQFYEDALKWLKMAEGKALEEKQEEVRKAGEILSRDYDIDCGPTGRVVCPVCNGSTVVIRKTYLGEQYKTCGYCEKKGYLNCPEYNQLLRGELKPTTN